MVEIREMLVPAAIAGAAVAVFTAIIDLIPVVSLLNFACCLWLMAGGVFAVYLLKRGVGKVKLKDGAIVGVLSGVLFAVIETIFSAILMLIGIGANLAAIQQAFWGSGMEAPGLVAIGLVAIVFLFVVNLVFGVIFCTIGGVIGAKLFER
ncbi:MAG: hypothetical protein DRO89_06015 [Candidatus Altiarchaeales archaeon]|nr:MAG: hypothetical protein DRO89_06015 [Candidatus Altiarchaeales archaeon]